MKGWRTLGFNALAVAGVSVLQFGAGVDWTQYVSPSAALIIGGLVNIGLRTVTTSPVGKKA